MAAGVARIVDAFVARNAADPRIANMFKGQDLVRLRRVLKEQFCYLLGGGCSYSGRDMKTAHKDMGVQAADMGALVENLQAAMAAERACRWRAEPAPGPAGSPWSGCVVTR
ncbi:group I truncated hemoglobin [Sphingomonas sp. MMS24-JH45]